MSNAHRLPKLRSNSPKGRRAPPSRAFSQTRCVRVMIYVAMGLVILFFLATVVGALVTGVGPHGAEIRLPNGAPHCVQPGVGHAIGGLRRRTHRRGKVAGGACRALAGSR